MTPRERVLAALAGDRPDRVPCALGFFRQPLFGSRDGDELFDTDVRFVEFDPSPNQEGFFSYLDSLPPDIHVGSVAQLRTYEEWGYHPEHPGVNPLAWGGGIGAFVERIAAGLADPRRHEGLADEVRRLQHRGLAVAGAPPHLGGELFESAYRLRGFQRFMTDLLERPTLVDYLLDQLTAMSVRNCVAIVEAGVDVLLLDDDVAGSHGMLISPATWQRFFKPRMVQMIDAVRQARPELRVFYHSDGDFTRLLPELVEIGVDVVNPLAPDCMDAAAIRRTLGPRPAFWGTVGTAALWDTGTPDEIRRQVARSVAEVGPAGLLLSPAYDVDFTPRANIEAFVDAVRVMEG